MKIQESSHSKPKNVGTTCREDSSDILSNKHAILSGMKYSDESQGLGGTSSSRNRDNSQVDDISASRSNQGRSSCHTNPFFSEELRNEKFQKLLSFINKKVEGLTSEELKSEINFLLSLINKAYESFTGNCPSTSAASRALEDGGDIAVPHANSAGRPGCVFLLEDPDADVHVSGKAFLAAWCKRKGSERLVVHLWLPQMNTAFLIEVSLKDLGIYTISGQKISFPETDGATILGKEHITTRGGLLELENTSTSHLDGKCKNNCRQIGCKVTTSGDGFRCDMHPPHYWQDPIAGDTHNREESGYLGEADSSASLTFQALGRFKNSVAESSEFRHISDDSHLCDKSVSERILKQFIRAYQNDKRNSNLNREPCLSSRVETSTVCELPPQIEKFGSSIVAVPCEGNFPDMPASEAEPEHTNCRSRPFDSENEKLCDFRLLEENLETNKAVESYVKDLTYEREKVSSYQKGQPSPLSKEEGMEADLTLLSNGNDAPGNREVSKLEQEDVCNDPVQPTYSQQLQDKAELPKVTENKSYLGEGIQPQNHPNYSDVGVRLGSSVGWPDSSGQDPALLADAGLNYADFKDPSSTSVVREPEDGGAESSQGNETVCEQKVIDKPASAQADDDLVGNEDDSRQHKDGKKKCPEVKLNTPDYQNLKDYEVNTEKSANKTEHSSNKRLSIFFSKKKRQTLLQILLLFTLRFELLSNQSSEKGYCVDIDEVYKYCMSNIDLSLSRHMFVYPAVVRYPSYAGDLINYVTGYHSAELDLPEPDLPQYPLDQVVQQLPAPDLPFTAGQSNGTNVNMAGQAVEQPGAAQQPRNNDLPLPAEEASDDADVEAEEGDDFIDLHPGNNVNVAVQAAEQPRDDLPLPAEEASYNEDVRAELGDDLSEGSLHTSEVGSDSLHVWSEDDDEETVNLIIERQNDDDSDDITQQKLLKRIGTVTPKDEKHGQETFPSEAGPVVRLQMVSADNRITHAPGVDRGSYTGWPEKKPPVEKMVDAGFSYTGHSDRVRCPAFGCTLQQFMVNDDPLEEHALHHPYCPFVRQALGETAIDEILARREAPVETHIYRRFLTSEVMVPSLSRLPRTGNHLVFIREAINTLYQTQGEGIQPTREALVWILAYLKNEIDRELDVEAGSQGATGYTPPGNQRPGDF